MRHQATVQSRNAITRDRRRLRIKNPCQLILACQDPKVNRNQALVRCGEHRSFFQPNSGAMLRIGRNAARSVIRSPFLARHSEVSLLRFRPIHTPMPAVIAICFSRASSLPLQQDQAVAIDVMHSDRGQLGVNPPQREISEPPVHSAHAGGSDLFGAAAIPHTLKSRVGQIVTQETISAGQRSMHPAVGACSASFATAICRTVMRLNRSAKLRPRSPAFSCWVCRWHSTGNHTAEIENRPARRPLEWQIHQGWQNRNPKGMRSRRCAVISDLQQPT